MIAADRTLLEQARELQALAQTGLAYCKDPFDRERYERIRAIAVDMLAMQGRRAGRRDAPAAQRRIPDAETRYSRSHLRRERQNPYGA